jgi:uncharacterized protein (DUF1330 family)
MNGAQKFLEHVRAALAGVPDDQPVVMLNLLRYRPAADYPPGSDFAPCSGREAYERYGRRAIRFVAGVGGAVMWRGGGQATLIGPATERWDELLLVRYPSKQAFLAMVGDPDYQAIVVHRAAALEDSRLAAFRAQE